MGQVFVDIARDKRLIYLRTLGMACATVKISMTNLAPDEKNTHKYLQHNRARNSARRTPLSTTNRNLALCAVEHRRASLTG